MVLLQLSVRIGIRLAGLKLQGLMGGFAIQGSRVTVESLVAIKITVCQSKLM